MGLFSFARTFTANDFTVTVVAKLLHVFARFIYSIQWSLRDSDPEMIIWHA